MENLIEVYIKHSWKYSIAIGIFIIGLLSVYKCDKSLSNPIDEELCNSLDNNFIVYKMGQKWSYKRMFIHIGSRQFLDIPDTSVGYTNFEVISDTLIGYELYFLVNGWDYHVKKDTILGIKKRFAVSNNELGIKVVSLSDSFVYYLPTFPAKKAFVEGKDELDEYNIFGEFQAPSNSIESDTEEIQDSLNRFHFPIRFPLEKSKPWLVWLGKEDNEVSKEFMECSEVNLSTGKKMAVKIQWHYANFQPFVTGYDWYGREGLLLREFNCGEQPAVNEQGDTLGFMQVKDIIQYIGTGLINADTLVPWGKK